MPSPFRRGAIYWIRVPVPGARSVQRSTGTADLTVARHVGVFLDQLKRQHATDVLQALAAGRLPLDATFRAWQERRLPQFLAAGAAQPMAALIDRWQAELARRGSPSPSERARYRRVAEAFAADVPTVADFTKHAVRAYLGRLTLGQPNRHRAALSSLAAFAVLEDSLPANPVRAVPAAKEAAPRDRHLSPAEVAAFLSRFPAEDAAIQALLVITAADVDSLLAVRVVDVDAAQRSVRVRGTKRAHRDRTCYCTPTWAPLWDRHVAPWLQSRRAFSPLERVTTRTYLQVRRRFLEEVSAAGIVDYAMKDHRHTWAVQAFKDGIPVHAIARQLGHASPVMALKVYGRHQPARQDYGWTEARQTG